MTDLDMDHLKQWLGKTQVRHDTLDPWKVEALQASLDLESAFEGAGPDVLAQVGAPIPPLWHWMYFLDAAPSGQLGPDGHAARGGFLPPVPLPRRMWARGRLWWQQPMLVGGTYERRSTVKDITVKQGRSGTLVFVLVEHLYVDESGQTLLKEWHDIVYREAPTAPYPAVPSEPPANYGLPDGTQLDWQQSYGGDPTRLFRYSALTFNTHRIHYDQDYVRDEEGYPGLIVHGPLIATLAVRALQYYAPDRALSSFDFKMKAPLFDGHPFLLGGTDQGESAKVYALGPNGIHLEGDAIFAPPAKPE